MSSSAAESPSPSAAVTKELVVKTEVRRSSSTVTSGDGSVGGVERSSGGGEEVSVLRIIPGGGDVVLWISPGVSRGGARAVPRVCAAARGLRLSMMLAAEISDVAFPGECASYRGGERTAEMFSRERAAANASSPYGIPKRPKLSLELRNLICSGVGPDRGYDNSVRINVVGIGAEMFMR